MLVAGGERALLAGNMRVSALARLHEIEPGSTVVLELSSAQLEGLAGTGLRTRGAIVTNLMADHLDRYADMPAYAEAKLSLVANQRAGDWAVIPEGGGWADWFAARAGATVVRPDLRRAPPGWPDARISGRHNRANLALAAAAARQAGVDEIAIERAVRGFGGVSARQEMVGTIDGIRAVNDTTATTPEAALTALAARAGTLGADRRRFRQAPGLCAPGCAAARDNAGLRGVVLLPGAGTDRLLPLLDGCRVDTVADMAQAVDRALALARPGDALLLSPACASFGLFANEFDRGDQFVARLRQLGLQPPARPRAGSDPDG